MRHREARPSPSCARNRHQWSSELLPLPPRRRRCRSDQQAIRLRRVLRRQPTIRSSVEKVSATPQAQPSAAFGSRSPRNIARIRPVGTLSRSKSTGPACGEAIFANTMFRCAKLPWLASASFETSVVSAIGGRDALIREAIPVDGPGPTDTARLPMSGRWA